MPLESVDRSTPPFFRQGLSSLSKLLLLGLLCVLLMVADLRLQIARPIRSALATVMHPFEWLVLQPGRVADTMGQYFSTVGSAQEQQRALQSRTIANAQRLQSVEQLERENRHLRELLQLRTDLAGPARAVQVLYEASDPYSQRIVVDQGLLSGIVAGSAAIHENGVVGQVTRVYPLTSEVTLLTDRDQSIPVMNARTGARFIAYGDPDNSGGALELRFVPTNADLQAGDLLTTNGLDGVYPPGLHVGKVQRIDRRVDTSFARVQVTPVALRHGRHLLLVMPHKDWPARPAPEPQVTARKPQPKKAGGAP